MGKKLCELKKMRKKDPARYAKLVANPKFFCKECGRVAQQKKRLCQPKKLEPVSKPART